jgi:leucyl aminopeptidase (aminopeptidase T)
MTMENRDISAGARRLVEVNGRVTRGEAVVVLTDESMTEIAGAVAAAARSTGADVLECIMGLRDHDGQEPPAAAAAAMSSADVIFSPVRRSITHTRAMRSALERGARAVLMTAHTPEILSAPSLLETDFQAQIPVCRRLGAHLTSGDRIHLTAPGGTDLTFSLAGRRRANVLTAIPDPGELAPVPTIEVNVVPIEGSAQGRVVADCSVPYIGIGILEEPIECDVKDGYITSIIGGAQADLLRQDLESHQDRNCFNVAELGVGLNPNARRTGHMLEDEGILGTVHIGIGTSFTLGGTIVAPTHYDLLLWDPTIQVDGRTIFTNRTVTE